MKTTDPVSWFSILGRKWIDPRKHRRDPQAPEPAAEGDMSME
jgi:hypothetical protein